MYNRSFDRSYSHRLGICNRSSLGCGRNQRERPDDQCHISFGRVRDGSIKERDRVACGEGLCKTHAPYCNNCRDSKCRGNRAACRKSSLPRWCRRTGYILLRILRGCMLERIFDGIGQLGVCGAVLALEILRKCGFPRELLLLYSCKVAREGFGLDIPHATRQGALHLFLSAQKAHVVVRDAEAFCRFNRGDIGL